MDEIKEVKECLAKKIKSEFDKGIDNIDVTEMGMAIDMLKDISKAWYNCTITSAMLENKYGEDYDEHGAYKYYIPKHDYYRDMDRHDGRMYYTEEEHAGKSGKMRTEYYNVKDNGDNTVRMRKLEDYIRALSDDVMEMVNESMPMERDLIRTHLTTILNRI